MAVMPSTLNVAVATSNVSGSSRYLSVISDKDKVWDSHRASAAIVAELYVNTEMESYAERMQDCSNILGFDVFVNESNLRTLKLRSARFCRCRNCPVCIWRRSLLWRAKFYQLVPKLVADYPTARFLFLTLTVRNVQIEDLRTTLKYMNESWTRLTERSEWPADGYLKTVEVTRERDEFGSFTGYVHPHFHCILMVKSSYFSGNYYLPQERWAQLWQEALRIDYAPVVDIRVVRPKSKKKSNAVEEIQKQMMDALTETLKYSVKIQDLVGEQPNVPLEEAYADNQKFLLQLTEQLHKTRAISIGGVFRKYIKKAEQLTDPSNEEMIQGFQEGTIEGEEAGQLYFGWQTIVQRYIRIDDV